MIHLIIAGGRSFANYSLLREKVDFMLSDISEEIEIVSGLAAGADSLGCLYAHERNLPVKHFPANWNKFGKSAGFKRNLEMASYANAAICFWDGKSKGTQDMIRLAKERGLWLIVINY